jgi:uncharacterized membrane protein
MEEQKNMQNEGQDSPQQASQENVQADAQPIVSEPVVQEGSGDSSNAKIWGILGYIFPIIFFIPLVMDDLKKNPYSKFHANQQLVFLLFIVIGYIVSAVLMVVLIGFLLYLIVMIGSLVFFIMGIINAAKGEMKPLPLIGGITIIK